MQNLKAHILKDFQLKVQDVLSKVLIHEDLIQMPQSLFSFFFEMKHCGFKWGNYSNVMNTFTKRCNLHPLGDVLVFIIF